MPTTNTTSRGSEIANSSNADPESSVTKSRTNCTPLLVIFKKWDSPRRWRTGNVVLHPALSLRRQNNLLHVEGCPRKVELERILKADHCSTLRRRGSGIQL